MTRSEAQSLSGQCSVGGVTQGAPAICTACAAAATGTPMLVISMVMRITIGHVFMCAPPVGRSVHGSCGRAFTRGEHAGDHLFEPRFVDVEGPGDGRAERDLDGDD